MAWLGIYICWEEKCLSAEAEEAEGGGRRRQKRNFFSLSLFLPRGFKTFFLVCVQVGKRGREGKKVSLLPNCPASHTYTPLLSLTAHTYSTIVLERKKGGHSYSSSPEPPPRLLVLAPPPFRPYRTTCNLLSFSLRFHILFPRRFHPLSVWVERKKGVFALALRWKKRAGAEMSLLPQQPPQPRGREGGVGRTKTLSSTSN